MSYQAEKKKIELKMQRIKGIMMCVLLVVLLGLCIFSAFVPPDTWKYHVGKPTLTKRKEGELRMHFLYVGQGDAILIELPDGKVALVDGGDNRESTELVVMRYLNALGIDTIDYLVATHTDADHCGSLDAVVAHKKILNAYLPTTKPENAGKEYASLYANLLEEECAMHFNQRYRKMGNAEGENSYIFTFVYPYSSALSDGELPDDPNMESAVLWLDYRGVSTLLTGDAPYAVEGFLMREDRLGMFENTGVELSSTEILKVSHHGSGDATGYDFLEYLHAETAIISCGKNNIYGHPTSGVLNHLSTAGVTTYRTDELGSIVVTISADGSYTVG